MKRSRIKLWFSSRRWRDLWWSAPVLLVFAAWIVFGYCMLRWKHQEIGANYATIVEKAFFEKKFETARIGCQRLLSLGAEPRSKWLFNLGLAQLGLKKDHEASSLFATLAPLDKDQSGYLPAHIFLAEALMKTNATLQEVRTAEAHLIRALSIDPKFLGANELLARVYLRTGQLELACERLREVVATHPEVSLLLAAVLKERGDAAGSRSWADRAARFHREKLENSRLDLPEHRCGLAEALGLLGDYAQAVRVLEDGWKLSSDPSYAPTLGSACALWVDEMAKKNSPDLELRITTIQKGLQYSPQNETLLKHLVKLSQLQGVEGQKARDTLAKVLAEGKAAAIIHFALGLDAWQRGQGDLARKHFGLSFESAPQMPDVGNNMAMILVLSDPPDLPRALGIIQSVLEKYPNNPSYRETRGQILARMGRWQEAVVDLEFALPSVASRRSTHSALAQAYKGLGSQDLAMEHERLAKLEPSATR